MVAATNSLEEARATYSALIARVSLEQLDRRTPFRWQSEMVTLGPVSVVTQEYGAAFLAASSDTPSLHTMSFPLGSIGGEATFGGLSQAVARGRSTYVYSTAGRASFRWDTHYRGVQLMVNDSEVSATLGALLGTPLGAPCRFSSRLSLESGVGSALDRAVRFVSEEATRDDGLFATPLAAQRFGESILLKLLESHSHNYSDHLSRLAHASDPRSVRVAAEYLEAHLGSSVRIADLAKVAGVSVRALQLGFKKHRGCTPAEFLRDRRLTLARAHLLEAGPAMSIAEVAHQSGFAHLGRFSARYRARFGELPTETRPRR